MANTLNSKAKMQKALMEVTQRLATTVHVLEAIRQAPHPAEWSQEFKQQMLLAIDAAIAQAKSELKV